MTGSSGSRAEIIADAWLETGVGQERPPESSSILTLDNCCKNYSFCDTIARAALKSLSETACGGGPAVAE